MHQMERPMPFHVLAVPSWFPADDSFLTATEPLQQKETQTSPTQQQHLFSDLRPQPVVVRKPVRTASSESDDTVKDAKDRVDSVAPVAEGDEDVDADDLLHDNDDEEDDTFSKTPVPRLIARKPKKPEDGGDDSLDNPDVDDDEDLSWSDVPPPAALASVLDEFDPLLQNLVALSIESVQQQAGQARAAQVVKATEAAEAAATAQAEAADIEARRLGKQPVSPGQLSPDDGHDHHRRRSSTSSGKRPSVEQQQGLLFPSPLPRPRRTGFASRLRRHVHVFGANSDAGESSATGAAMGAALATLSPVGLLGTMSGRTRQPITSLPRRESASISTQRPAPQTEDKKRAAMLLSMLRKGQEAKKPLTVECTSCFDDVPTRESVRLVCHSYCLGCFVRLVENAMENEAQYPPKCCLNEVPAKTVLRYVSNDLGRRYKAKAAEMRVPVGERFYCPTVDCGVFVPPNQIACSARVARCGRGHESCTLCRQPAHGNGAGPCPEDRDQQMADELVETAGWRRCIRCGVIIEHHSACQHMTCRCGAQFCYVCRAPWRTCSCDIGALMRLKATAADRQRAQKEQEEREREAAEEADRELQEIREAVRRVEECQQAEAITRAIRRRRLRSRLQGLRAEREQQLRVEIASKYDGLRAALADMNRLHHAAARAGRDSDLVNLVKVSAAERSSLRVDHAAARVAAAAVADDRVAAAEAAWKADFAARVRLERALEAAYRAQMESDLELWALTALSTEADHADRVALIDAAVADYQRTNDARFDAYAAWRARELEVTRHAAEEERAVHGEELDRAAEQLRTQQRATRAALLHRHAAERVWCQAVAAERGRMLVEMEAAEVELGLPGSVTDNDSTLLMLLDMLGPGDNDDDDAAIDEDEMAVAELSARTLFEDSGYVDEDETGDAADDNDVIGGSRSVVGDEHEVSWSFL